MYWSLMTSGANSPNNCVTYSLTNTVQLSI